MIHSRVIPLPVVIQADRKGCVRPYAAPPTTALPKPLQHRISTIVFRQTMIVAFRKRRRRYSVQGRSSSAAVIDEFFNLAAMMRRPRNEQR